MSSLGTTTHTDETFIVLEGSMGIEFRDRTVQLSEKEMIVGRRGEDHKPFADEEDRVLLVKQREWSTQMILGVS